MRVEKGDRVRFLNEVGGGIVTRMEGSLAFVEDEDGFEIPVPSFEVVVVEKHGQSSSSDDNKADSANVQVSVNEDVSQPEAYHEELEESSQDDFNPRFYLAYIKTGNNQTEEGKLQSYIINDSNYYVTYLISSPGQDGLMYAKHQGMIEPNSKLPLEESLARDLDVIYHIQLILFKKGKGFPAINPVSASVQIKARKFYKENSFRANDFFFQPAVLFSLIKNELEKKMDLLSANDTQQIIMEKEREELPVRAKRRNTPEMEEVDLHINELIDSSEGMSNSEILQVQLDRFHFVIEQNKKNKGKKIVFIHGVGNGVLKNEIRKQLERKYKGLNYQDASFREYGFGATMVII